MPLVEVHQSLDLSVEECMQADLHSLLNIINLLYEELKKMGAAYDRPQLLGAAEACVSLLSEFADDPEKTIASFLHAMKRIELQARDILTEHPQADGEVSVLLAVIGVFRDRLAELTEDRFAWAEVKTENVFRQLFRFLDATSIVSRGRFHIVYEPNDAVGADYQLDVAIEPELDVVSLPPVLNDILRDLVANARKYSEPPARIEVRLRFLAEGEIELEVRDNGLGIPADEISDVVKMGYRATNMRERRTMGGGIGLTKAYLMAKHFGGRFWIDSTLGEGTTVRLTMKP